MLKNIILSLCLCFFSSQAYCQTDKIVATEADRGERATWSISFRTGLSVPLGADTEFFTPGASFDLSGGVRFPWVLHPELSANLGYILVPIRGDTTLSVLSLALHPVLTLEILHNFFVSVFGRAGYFLAFLNDGTTAAEGYPYFAGGLGVSYRLLPAFSLGLDVSYRAYMGLYNDFNANFVATYHFGIGPRRPVRKEEIRPIKPEPLAKERPLLRKGEGLELRGLELPGVFPVLFKYYDENPVGKITLKNPDKKTPVENLELSFFVKQYMDNPKTSARLERLDPEEQRDLDLYALFTNELLKISEASKVSALVAVEYDFGGKHHRLEQTESMRVHGRNAMSWDDTRKAASFVTTKDSVILRFSKQMTGLIKEHGNRAMNRNLQTAMILHHALSLYGMKYVIDPTTPYSELSKDTASVDFLQFPRQSLDFKAGDCDDLSILYCALLESVGIETALITVPGHVFVAFSLEIVPEEARNVFSRPDDLIFREGRTWLPVEITVLDKGFLSAWELGAKEWWENQSRGQADFFPVHEAWKEYEPTGFSFEDVAVILPSEGELTKSFSDEFKRLIDREIYPRVSNLQVQITESQGSPNLINKLGVLYARYGLEEQAEEQFSRILAKNEYVPAIYNMGNLFYMRKELKEALRYYERAGQASPDNANVVLAFARVNHELENYGVAREAYGRLKELSPKLASRFAYLDLRGEEASRAADAAGVREVVLWEE